MFLEILKNLELSGGLIQVNFDQILTSDQQLWLAKINQNLPLVSAVPLRVKQFSYGRLCAAEALMNSGLDGDSALNIAIGEKREPLWPKGYRGSISHDKEGAVAIAGPLSKVRGLGIDIEEWGRVKPEIATKILHPNDLRLVPGLSEEELLTLIFSAKEALYKALFPLVQKFFGFDYAAVTQIDLKQGLLTIELTQRLNDEFGPTDKASFQLFWSQNKGRLITFLAISK